MSIFVKPTSFAGHSGFIDGIFYVTSRSQVIFGALLHLANNNAYSEYVNVIEKLI